MGSLLPVFLSSLLSASIDIPNGNNAQGFTGLEIHRFIHGGSGEPDAGGEPQHVRWRGPA